LIASVESVVCMQTKWTSDQHIH